MRSQQPYLHLIDWFYFKVAGVNVNLRQTWNFRSHAVSTCIGLWHHRSMHAPHRLMHACTACIAPWHHRPMHAVTAWDLLFWFHCGNTFISSYFVSILCRFHRHLRYIDWLMARTASLVCLVSTVSGCHKKHFENKMLVAGTKQSKLGPIAKHSSSFWRNGNGE